MQDLITQSIILNNYEYDALSKKSITSTFVLRITCDTVKYLTKNKKQTGSEKVIAAVKFYLSLIVSSFLLLLINSRTLEVHMTTD